jgi:hypothetical protein
MLVVLLGFLIACGGGEETQVADTPTQESPATAAPAPTTPPTDIPIPEGPHATVVDVVNDVDADPLAQGEWQDALAEMTIYLSGQVWARESSTARVSVEEDLVRVAPNTIFTLEQPDSDTIQLTLDEGQVWVNVEGLSEGEAFQVETPAAVASVRGTQFSAKAASDGTTIVSTKVGTVTVSAAGESVEVPGGSQTTVPPGDPPGESEPMSPEQQVLWGNAVGAGLDAHLPAVGDPGVMTYTGYILSTDWSSDGKYFAYSYYDSRVHEYMHMFYDTDAGGAVDSQLPEGATGIFYNPAGDTLAYQHRTPHGTEICRSGMDGATINCVGGEATYGWPFWSPDGKSIAYYSNTQMQATKAGGRLSMARQGDVPAFNLYRVSPDGSERTQLTHSEEGNNIRQAWSPDGERIAYVYAPEYSGPGDVWVMDADGSNAQILFEGIYANGFDHLVWSPNGSLLAVPAEEGGLWLVPTDGSDPSMEPGTEGWTCWTPLWSPNEDGWPLFFYSHAPDEHLPMLWYLTEPGGEPWSLGYASWGPWWTADGSHLAIGFTDYSGDEPETEVLFFPAEPDFWGQ